MNRLSQLSLKKREVEKKKKTLVKVTPEVLKCSLPTTISSLTFFPICRSSGHNNLTHGKLYRLIFNNIPWHLKCESMEMRILRMLIEGNFGLQEGFSVESYMAATSSAWNANEALQASSVYGMYMSRVQGFWLSEPINVEKKKSMLHWVSVLDGSTGPLILFVVVSCYLHRWQRHSTVFSQRYRKTFWRTVW